MRVLVTLPRVRLVAVMVAALACAWAAPAAQARVPHHFVGSFVEGGILNERGVVDGEFNTMVRAGVGSVRMTFDWRSTQPYARFEDVPADQRSVFREGRGGVPTDWRELDGWMTVTSTRRLRVLPVVVIAPRWAARHPGSENSPPGDFQAYARFLQTLVDRYGPNGTFWTEHPELPRLPIRDWQAWNEPHLLLFWGDQPFYEDYTELLRVSRAALREADPSARLIMAGLANESWKHLRRLYRRGARGHFDVLALHPFTGRSVDGVLEIVRRNRRVMARAGDRRTPVKITELSWSSARGRTDGEVGNETTRAGQARMVRQALPRLARARKRLRLESFHWYNWLSFDRDRHHSFDYAGLRWIDEDNVVRPKPAFHAFRRAALELVGCRAKRRVADRCAR